jgi:hypothetical protein
VSYVFPGCIEELYILHIFYVDDLLLLLPSVDVNPLSPAPVGSVGSIIAVSPGAGGDNVISSDAISVNAAGADAVSACVTFGLDAAFLLAVFFLAPVRALAVTFFFLLPFFLTFESFARFPFFSLLLAFAITVSIS